MLRRRSYLFFGTIKPIKTWVLTSLLVRLLDQCQTTANSPFLEIYTSNLSWAIHNSLLQIRHKAQTSVNWTDKSVRNSVWLTAWFMYSLIKCYSFHLVRVISFDFELGVTKVCPIAESKYGALFAYIRETQTTFYLQQQEWKWTKSTI